MTSPLSRRDVIRAALLVVAAALIWIVSTGAWRYEVRRTPPGYRIDGIEALARVEVVREKGLAVFADKRVPRLGAPFVADWSAYPIPDVPVFQMLGLVTGAIGAAAAAHFAILLAHVTSTLMLFFCSRALGHRPLFAGVAALLFGFSRFNTEKSFDHYSFALSFVVPASLLTAWLVGGSRELIGRWRWRLFCVAVAAYVGSANPYYGLMFAILVTFGGLYQLATQRRWTNVVTGLACVVVAGAVLVACHWQALHAMFVEHRHVLVRGYADSETFGLRPIELAIPPPDHRVKACSDFADHYARSLAKRGENSSSYLGIVGICGALGIGIAFVRSLVAGRGALRPAHAPTVLFLFAFGMVGGIAGAMALTVTDVFRAGNRYSIYVLAMALLAAAGWATRSWRARRGPVPIALTMAVLGIGLLDQLFQLPTEQQAIDNHFRPEVDRRLGQQLEQTLAPGSMIFQVPVRPFLEQPAIGGMTDYEELRPFVFSRTMRFSYGLLVGDPGLVWQRRVERLPANEMLGELQQAGFAALHVYRGAFPDNGNSLRDDCEKAGMKVLFDEGPHLVLRFEPAAAPKVPELVGANRYPPWDHYGVGTQRLVLLEAGGWHGMEKRGEQRWRWAGQRADCVLWNPTAQPRDVRLRGSVEGFLAPLAVSLDDGTELWRSEVVRTPRECVIDLALPPGETRLHWRFFGKTGFAGRDDSRILGFKVTGLTVEPR